MLGHAQIGITNNTGLEGLAQLVSELTSILAALQWHDSAGGPSAPFP